MTQEVIKLRDELIKELEKRGFIVKEYHFCETYVMLSMENDSHEEITSGWGFTQLNGLTIDICLNKPFPNNKEEEYKSFYVMAMGWRYSNGKVYEKVKISENDGKRKRTNAINKVVNAYMKMRNLDPETLKKRLIDDTDLGKNW